MSSAKPCHFCADNNNVVWLQLSCIKTRSQIFFPTFLFLCLSIHITIYIPIATKHQGLAHITFIFCFIKSANHLHSLVVNRKHSHEGLVHLSSLIQVYAKALSPKVKIVQIKIKLFPLSILNFAKTSLFCQKFLGL